MNQYKPDSSFDTIVASNLPAVVAAAVRILLIVVTLPLLSQTSNSTLDPTGLAVANGIIYLSEAARHRVLFRSEQQHEFEPLATDDQLKEPAGIAVDDHYVYVADPAAHNVFKIDKTSHSVVPLLSPGASISPSSLVLQANYDIGGQKLNKRPGLLILDKDSKHLWRLDLSGQIPADSLNPVGESTFSEPITISGFERTLLVSDKGSKTVFESTNGQRWFDVRNTDPSLSTIDEGFFFQNLSGPLSAQLMSDVIYVIDNQRIFALLRDKNRLVPLMYRDKPLISPQQIAVDLGGNLLVISDRTEQGITTWPLLIPITVEVEAAGDISTPLADLYEYLWKEGVLPTVTVKIPYETPAGNKCASLTCIIEKGRNLQPKTNLKLEQTLCAINPSLCHKNKMTRLRLGESLLVPDAPFDSYLSVNTVIADGKSSVEDLVEHQIPDKRLRRSISAEYVKALNQPILKHYHSVPPKGTKLDLPVQRTRYYFAVRKLELFGQNSKLAELLFKYPQLEIRPYGVFVSDGLISGSQGDHEIVLHTTEEIKKAYDAVLTAIDFRTEKAARYGRADDVPVLVIEPKADCQHPAFFKSDSPDEHAFDTPECVSPEPVSESIIIDWSETDKRHGTCVASIIGGKTSPYGAALASGANLRLSSSGTVDTTTIVRMYENSLRPFVVNISSVNADVGAGPSWKNLLAKGISKYGVFVAAAGNDNALLSAKNEYPALLADSFPNVISVGALDQTGLWVWEDGTKQQGSNSGFAVEILAPGAEVPCATEVLDGKAVYTIAPGTSFAAPLVSAAAALLLEKGLTPPEVKARLLSTAVPLEKQRSGEPLARFGRLSVARALLDLNSSHFDYPTNGTQHLDANTPTQNSEIRYQSSTDPLQKWIPLPLSDVLSIDLMPGTDGENNLYRVVRFSADSPGRIVLVDAVLLSGCFPTTKKGTGEQFLVLFGAACALAGDFPPDHWVSNPKTFIAPRAGIDKFQ